MRAKQVSHQRDGEFRTEYLTSIATEAKILGPEMKTARGRGRLGLMLSSFS